MMADSPALYLICIALERVLGVDPVALNLVFSASGQIKMLIVRNKS